jgi:hypothetical protein
MISADLSNQELKQKQKSIVQLKLSAKTYKNSSTIAR